MLMTSWSIQCQGAVVYYLVTNQSIYQRNKWPALLHRNKIAVKMWRLSKWQNDIVCKGMLLYYTNWRSNETKYTDITTYNIYVYIYITLYKYICVNRTTKTNQYVYHTNTNNCIQTYMHICMHAYIHTYIHTYIEHTLVYIYIHTLVYIYK